jgi:hypothetical protein
MSLLAAMFIGRRVLLTSIWHGGAGIIPGLNEDFYAWLCKWGAIALSFVQESPFFNEDEPLRMPLANYVEETEDQDLEEETAMRSGIGFRRQWIRPGAVPRRRRGGVPTRTQNLRSALYFLRATFGTYFPLAVRYLRGEEMRPTAPPPFRARDMTPFQEEEDEDYVFSDRETSPSLSEDEYEESVRASTPGLAFSREPTPVPRHLRRSNRRFIRDESPFAREPSPFRRETSPFDTLEEHPPSSFNNHPPSVGSSFLEDEDNINPINELFPNFASTIDSLLNPSSQAEFEDSQLLMSHLSSPNVLTRSRYREATESQRLQALIRNRRPPRSSTEREGRYPAEIQKCAVCKTNPRVIVNWPCRYTYSRLRLM